MMFENHYKILSFITTHTLEVCAPAMRSKRYVFFQHYADDQASRWTQKAPKPSQSISNMAPTLPNIAPGLTQVHPKGTIWLHKNTARAILAFQQGVRVLCPVSNATLTSYKHHCFIMNNCKQVLQQCRDNAKIAQSMAQHDPNIGPNSPQIIQIHLEDCAT